MRKLDIGVFFTLLFIYSVSGFADSDFNWPQPDPPYQQTDPFINPVKSNLDDQETTLEEQPSLQPEGVEDVPLQELPLESDPLLRTPLEEQQEEERDLPDTLEQDEPLPDHPLEDLDSPLSQGSGEKKNSPEGIDTDSILAYASMDNKAVFSAVVEEKHLHSWVTSANSIMRDGGLEPVMLSRGNFDSMYWTIAQMVVHHTSTGANLRAGDLLGSGTISGSEDCSRGCLLELVEPGTQGLLLPDGTRRTYLEDGDEVILKAYSHREGLPRIGFGECCGIVVEADEI